MPDSLKQKRAAFVWEDPFLLQDQLDEEERLVSEAARRFAAETLAPGVREAHRRETYDPAMMRAYGEAGFLGVGLDGYGCPGGSAVMYGLVAREVERCDSAYRSAMSVQSSLVMFPIHAYGTEAQKEKYLPKLASGEWIGAFGLTEPDHGSDAGGMAARARKVPGGYRITGAKMWITQANIADVFVIWAKDDEDVIRGFLLERGMEGLATAKIEGKFSLRAWPTGEIAMDGRVRAGREPPSPCARPWRPVRLPEQGALRHRLGVHGRGRVLLACGAAIYARPACFRPPAGAGAADPEEARRHADRDRARPPGRPARRAADG